MLSKKKAILLLIVIIFTVNCYSCIVSTKNLVDYKLQQYKYLSTSIFKEFLLVDDYAKFALVKINQHILQKKIYKSEDIFTVLSEINKLGQIKDNDLSLFTVLYWVGNDNYLLASSSGKINKPIDLSSRKYLDYSNKNFGKIIFSSPIIGVVSNENILPISLTLTSEKGYVVGTSVLSVQIKELLTKLSQFKTPNEEFMILSQNNILLSSYEDFQKIINQDKLSFSATKWQIIFSFFSNKNKEFLLFEEKSEDFSIVIAVKRQYFVDEMKNIMLPYLVQAINIILLLFFLR